MGKYICLHCNFRFNSNNPHECPYCGKQNFEKEKSAEELLSDVNELLE